jgi:hypothetical protein
MRNGCLEEQVRLLLRTFVKNERERAELEMQLVETAEAYELFQLTGAVPTLQLRPPRMGKHIRAKSSVACKSIL